MKVGTLAPTVFEQMTPTLIQFQKKGRYKYRTSGRLSTPMLIQYQLIKHIQQIPRNILGGVLKQKNPTIDCPWTRTQASEPSNPWGSSAPCGYTSKHQGGGSFWGGFRWKKQGICIQRSRDGFVSGYCFSYFFVDWCSFHVVGPLFVFYWGSVDFEPIQRT